MNVLRFADLVAAGRASGRRVFIRADLNVPQDDAGRITEDTRIRASIPCIRMALDAGAAVMVTSHLGRPTEGEFKPEDYGKYSTMKYKGAELAPLGTFEKKVPADVVKKVKEKEKAILDGSFDKLFQQYFGEGIRKAHLETRTVIELQNPLLTPETPTNRPELWYDFRRGR